MKVYMVQCYNDVNNNYKGIDDTEIYLYEDPKIAELKLFEKYTEKKIEIDFLGYSDEEDEYNEEKKSYYLSDYNSYYHGRIVEKEIL